MKPVQPAYFLRFVLLSCLFPTLLLCSGCVSSAVYESGMIELDGRNVLLKRKSDGPLLLQGPLEEELRNLPGAEVKVKGRSRAGQPHPRLKLDAYQLVDTGQGMLPHVGILCWNVGELLLDQGPGQPILSLRGPLKDNLRLQVGARAWVVGPVVADETIEVLQWGILRPPVKAP
ncbi:MAG: hypothetical protein ACKO6N_19890 [Myxococcota bacterium]